MDSYIKRLEDAIQQADQTGDKYKFQDPAYDIIEEVQLRENPFDAVRPILTMIENAPAIDFGGPGPLGSFLESFYHEGYEEELVASLKRKPTEYTVALMFRLIADADNPNREEYRALLKTLKNEPCLDDFWKNEIEKL